MKSISQTKSKLYKRDLYITDEYDDLVSHKIIEYDMKSAGWNLILYYDLLDSDKVKYLSHLGKKERTIQIGRYMRSDKEFNEHLTDAFKMIRKKFFAKNNIVDDDVLSIKKDAIFIVDKKCEYLKFENVEFVEKNIYTSYHRFGNIELYYSSKRDALDVKGINNDLLYQHISFINILKRIFKLLELNNKSEFVKFMKRFVDDYKNMRLDYKYYREFNSFSCFALKHTTVRGFTLCLPGMNELLDSDLDISYNYLNYLLPLIQRYYFNDVK